MVRILCFLFYNITYLYVFHKTKKHYDPTGWASAITSTEVIISADGMDNWVVDDVVERVTMVGRGSKGDDDDGGDGDNDNDGDGDDDADPKYSDLSEGEEILHV